MRTEAEWDEFFDPVKQAERRARRDKTRAQPGYREAIDRALADAPPLSPETSDQIARILLHGQQEQAQAERAWRQRHGLPDPDTDAGRGDG